MIDPFAPPEEVRARIERILRGESLAERADPDAVPTYYGRDATPARVAGLWRVWAERARPLDAEFFRAGAAHWAGRVRSRDTSGG